VSQWAEVGRSLLMLRYSDNQPIKMIINRVKDAESRIIGEHPIATSLTVCYWYGDELTNYKVGGYVCPRGAFDPEVFFYCAADYWYRTLTRDEIPPAPEFFFKSIHQD